MAVGSGIEWTEATWNPTTGCTKISPGCVNCYAEVLTKRLKAMGQKKYENGFQFVEHSDDLRLPLTWKKPKKIFVNSMSDLFHEGVSLGFVAECFITMIRGDWHIYQILTKRPQRMADFSKLFFKYFGRKIPHHIWMGTSVENEEYKWRIDELRGVDCQVKFVSIEPLIGPVGRLDLREINWVIIGGESGFNFRPVKKKWIMDIIEQCKEQKTAVFFKQWGGIRPKSGGRKIDGRTYNEYPKIPRGGSTIGDVDFDPVGFAKSCLKQEHRKTKWMR